MHITACAETIDNFIVFFECREPGMYLVEVAIENFQSFYFYKKCLSGVRTDLHLILDNDNEQVDVIYDGNVQEEFEFDNPTYTVDLSDG